MLVAAFIAVSPDPLVRWLIAPKIKRSRAVALILTVIALLLAGLGYATICHSSTRGISSVRTSLVTWNICASVRRASRAWRTNFNIQPKIESWAHQAPSILAHEGVGMHPVLVVDLAGSLPSEDLDDRLMQQSPGYRQPTDS